MKKNPALSDLKQTTEEATRISFYTEENKIIPKAEVFIFLLLRAKIFGIDLWLHKTAGKFVWV